MAVSPDGDSVFVWRRFDGTSTSCCFRVQLRARSAAGTWSGVKTLSGAGQNATDPQVAVDASGNAVFVWRRFDGTNTSCCDRIQARAQSADGILGAVQNLSEQRQNASSPRVAMHASGNAVFVWRRFDGTSVGCCDRIQAISRSPTGALSPVETLSDPGQGADDPRVAMDASANAVVVWARFDGTSVGCCDRIQARARSAAGVLSPVETLSDPGQGAGDPRVAMDASGNAVIVWTSSDGTSVGCCDRIQARGRLAPGILSAVETLSDPGQSADDPGVAMDASGNAVVAWARFDGAYLGCCDRIQARARSSRGALSPVETLSTAGQNAAGPQVAVDASGNAVFVWERFDGTSPGVPGCCDRIEARPRLAGGVLSPVEILSLPGQNALDPAVSVDPDGGLDLSSADGYVAWARFDGTSSTCCSRIQAAAQIASGP